jgi:hypothetical protein
VSGVLYQATTTIIEGHALGLINPQIQQQFEALVTTPMDSDAFVAGRVVGGVLGGAIGLAESVWGAGVITGGAAGGAATCLETLGGGCAAGLAIAGVGATATVAGIATAGNGINAAVDQLNILYAKGGGRYRDLSVDPTEERHHMPADSISPLSRDDGPAIRMKRTDHRQTASWGNSLAARAWRALQRLLIQQGRWDDAVQMDIDDVRGKFGSQYDQNILDMIDSLDD